MSTLSASRRLRITPLLAITVAILASFVPAAIADSGPEDYDSATGYRIARYRAPVPATVPGGTRIGIDEIDQLLATRNAILLDVMPSEGAGLDAPTGQWFTKRHETIPGATWLPDVGRGRVDARLDQYLRDNLVRLTGADKAHAVIVFCQSDCWMGWNAVQRIAALGYTSVYWYPDGVDGWRDWDRTLAPAVPVPAGTSANPHP